MAHQAEFDLLTYEQGEAQGRTPAEQRRYGYEVCGAEKAGPAPRPICRKPKGHKGEHRYA
jgi:hypothetical protein